MLFLGLDIGSSSAKVSIVDGDTGQCLGATHYPDTELEIMSPNAGWAEQHPEIWWDSIRHGLRRLCASASIDPKAIDAIGISYQMHGLVLVDAKQQVLRPAIIWCDSRAIPAGEEAFQALGADHCFDHLLNSPGNFTASKLRWVQQNEPDIFAQVHKFMLPGDYIAMKLSGQITTTASGLSEGVLWDFVERRPALELLRHWGISESLVPDIVPTIGHQATVSDQVAAELGLKPGVKIAYRGGDQPNNAFSLNVLEPGEVAATGGTSGVIYGVIDKPAADRKSRVNTFLHVNDTEANPRNGVLVCVNGTGRLYSWLRQLLSVGSDKLIDYPALNRHAGKVPVGSEGLRFYPFGNGAERIYQNRNPGAQMSAIDFNRHNAGHVARAAQEGIVFALNQGFDVLKSMGGTADVVRVARGNLFLSDIFTTTFASTTGAVVEVYDTDGAAGAARAAALGSGFYKDAREAFGNLKPETLIQPDTQKAAQYRDAYENWVAGLPRGVSAGE